MPSTSWETPIFVDLATYTFPAYVIGILIPQYDDLPQKFRARDSGFEQYAEYVLSEYEQLQSLKLKPEFVRANLDLDMVDRQLSAVARSRQPQRAHKLAALAYLLSLWLREGILDCEGN